MLKMPVKVVPPVLMMQQSLSTQQPIGPLTIMSGFMTKKARTLNRWKQRWWQLLDNGFLFYFKSDKRLKILGQIDIARTCYDVRFGSEKCRMVFPRAAPSCCCISFSVLKRDYYVYTPTAGEAEKWAQSLSSMSRVINRKVFAGVERRKAPDPPGGPCRPPSCPPDCEVKMTRVRAHRGLGVYDSCEDFTRIEYVKMTNTNLISQRAMAMSVPDCLDKIEDDCFSLEEERSLDSRLWLDGSPPIPQSGQVHPQESPSVADVSWGTPPTHAEQEAATAVVTRTAHSSTTSPRKERHLSLPANATMHFDNHNTQIEEDSSEELHIFLPSDAGPCSPSEDTLSSSKGLYQSLSDLLPNSSVTGPSSEARPIPMPRRARTQTNPVVNEPEEASAENPMSYPLLLSMRPRNFSEPPPIRPRKNSGGKNLSPHHHRNKGSGRRSRRLSPPSTPPPPPPFQVVKDNGPPSFIPTLPKPGPPHFVPPPPPKEN